MSIEHYLESLTLSDEGLDADPAAAALEGGELDPLEAAATAIPLDLKAAVNAGSLLSFVEGVTEQEKQDVLFSTQFAQRAANHDFNRFTRTEEWYRRYLEVLENLGWAAEQFAFATHRTEEGELRMDEAALGVVSAIATQNQLHILLEALKALERAAEGDRTIALFERHIADEGSGNFQLGAVQRAPNGSLSVALGAFHFRAEKRRARVLFFGHRADRVNFWTAAQKMTLNTVLYAKLRKRVMQMLGAKARGFIAQVKLA